MVTFLQDWLVRQGASDQTASLVILTVNIVFVVGLAFVANLVAKRFVVRALIGLASRTASHWDDAVIARRVFHRLSHLAPAVLIYLAAPAVLADYADWIEVVRRACLVYMLLAGVWVVDSLLNAVCDIAHASPASRELPVKSFVQVVKILVYGVAAIVVLSLIVGRSPLLLFSGLGALTAVLMLIFKDPILGFVAGIQLSANQMVARGDWIEMPKYGADGDVLEVALTTVKIQNFDMTITTIPTYALITESFKNWRGMSESSGRRIKRSINVDMQSIRFCDEEMLARLATIQYMPEYLERKGRELSAWNQARDGERSGLANDRRLTNVGTFRAYVVAYLRHHSMIQQDLTLMVRQLAPSQYGLPIEIYVFSSDKNWVNYEAIQADIFDHILAVMPQFGIRVYQGPSGGDVRALASLLEADRVSPTSATELLER